MNPIKPKAPCTDFFDPTDRSLWDRLMSYIDKIYPKVTTQKCDGIDEDGRYAGTRIRAIQMGTVINPVMERTLLVKGYKDKVKIEITSVNRNSRYPDAVVKKSSAIFNAEQPAKGYDYIGVNAHRVITFIDYEISFSTDTNHFNNRLKGVVNSLSKGIDNGLFSITRRKGNIVLSEGDTGVRQVYLS